MIHIYAAYFGIQSATTTTTCTSNSSEVPAACYFANSFDIINATCEYQSKCYLRATTTQIGAGDLCPSYAKQLYVQYQCMSASFLESTVNQCPVSTVPTSVCGTAASGVNQGIWCDRTTATISCSDSTKKIQVTCAFYGIDSSITKCNAATLQSKPTCYFASSKTTVQNKCNGLNSCTISDFSIFSDPCNGLDKALLVQWTCS